MLPDLSGRAHAYKRRIVGYDRQGVKDPVKLERFIELIQTAPQCSHFVEPSSHAVIVDRHVEEVAFCAFGPPPVKKPKQSWMTAEIMNGPLGDGGSSGRTRQVSSSRPHRLDSTSRLGRLERDLGSSTVSLV